MNNESPLKAVLVVILVALAASTLVSATVVILRPIQLNNKLLARSGNVMHLTGLFAPETVPSDEEMLSLYKGLDTRIVNIDEAAFDPGIDPYSFDERRAAGDPELSMEIPPELDLAKLGRRTRLVPSYLVWKDGEFDRIILPMHGSGMWSTLYGYIALESDFNTIADATFYEQNETPGLGDQVTRPDWLALWRGRRIFGDSGEPRFAVAGGRVDPGSPSALYNVDALTGATVTADAVTNLVQYWFGPHGYQPFLEQLREQPPVRPVPGEVR
jgi:Na+-transporting NADH:ubiquinone oxidoreductase subunit C